LLGVLDPSRRALRISAAGSDARKTPQLERRLAGGFSRGRGVRTVSSSDRQSADWRHSLAVPGDSGASSELPDRKRKSIGYKAC